MSHSLGSAFSMLASFLESTCWQEIASRVTRLCRPRFTSSRKRHPRLPGAPAKSRDRLRWHPGGTHGQSPWPRECGALTGQPESRAPPRLSRGKVVCSLKTIWKLLAREQPMH